MGGGDKQSGPRKVEERKKQRSNKISKRWENLPSLATVSAMMATVHIMPPRKTGHAAQTRVSARYVRVLASIFAVGGNLWAVAISTTVQRHRNTLKTRRAGQLDCAIKMKSSGENNALSSLEMAEE